MAVSVSKQEAHRPFGTWPALVEDLRARYELDAQEDDYVALTWRVSGERTQQVRVHFGTDGRGTAWVELLTGVCGPQHLTPAQALAENVHLVPGSLCLLDDSYDLAYRFPLLMLTPARLDSLLRGLAHKGDALEEQLTHADEY